MFRVEVVETTGPVVTVKVQGDLDYSTGPQLLEALEGLTLNTDTEVCVDLHGVAFIDSGGLRALLDARHLFPDRLSLRADGRARDMLEVTGCSRFLAIH